MNKKHTTGPWKWIQDDDDSNKMPMLISESGVEICNFGDCTQYYPTEGYPPDAQDARLIAAAPDLLEALQELHRVNINNYKHDLDDYENTKQCKMADAAIAKATSQ